MKIDYEILHYIVEWRPAIFDVGIYQQYFDTEESAVAFIEKHKKEWMMFRLLKIQNSPEYTHKWKEDLHYD